MRRRSQGAIADVPGGCFARARGLASAAAAVSGLLLAFLFVADAVREASMAAVTAALSRVGGWGAAAILAVNLAVSGAMCLRWRLMIARLGARVPFFRLVLYRCAANAVSMVTPGPQFGGEPVQVHLLARFHGLSLGAASASVVMDRLAEVAATVMVLGAAGLIMAHRGVIHGGGLWPMLPLAALLAAAFGWAITAPGAPLDDRMPDPPGWHSRGVPRRQWLKALAGAKGEAVRLLRQPPEVLAAYAGSALVHWVCTVAEFWLVYRCLGLPLGLFESVAMTVAARLAFLLPVPGAFGVLEGGQVLMLGRLGFDPSIGLAACCVFRGRDLLFTGFGIGLALHWLSPWSLRLKGGRPTAPPRRNAA